MKVDQRSDTADSNTLTVVLNKLHGDVLLISITKRPQVHTTRPSILLFSSALLRVGTSAYLAVVHGGHELIGAQGQLRPLIEVHPPAHMVKVLEVEDRHWVETSIMDE